MSEIWEESPPKEPNSPGEFLVSVEVYVSTSAATTLRKTPHQRRRSDRRDSLNPLSTATDDAKKIKEKSSRMSLSRNASGHWRPATCRLLEEGTRCLLNIYLEETMLYRTVNVHLLYHTDIRSADTSLFFRKDCLGINCAPLQSCSPASTEPIYLRFMSTDEFNTWFALLRSYAEPEVYGKSRPSAEGVYRMWRQVELTVIQGRNLGSPKPLAEAMPVGAVEAAPEPDATDLDVSCEIHLNDMLCARTTVKKGIGAPEWHESFTLQDLPPFENLDIVVWREKRFLKPAVLGTVRITLSNFRRGETVEGWFPVLHTGPVAAGLQVGEIRLKIRVDEEIILPLRVYTGLLDAITSRNFVEWMVDLETKLRLKTLSKQFMSIAVAGNGMLEQIFEFADREVDGTPSSHNTVFRGNTTLTKVVELCMVWHGKAFLEASIGNVLRRLCHDKVAIEVDPVRSGKSVKEIEKGVELLVYWCQEFWQQIYSARFECPQEMRRLFQRIRQLVENKYGIGDDAPEQTRELPWQSVSAFCFLRFIVPAIVHPYLFGLCPGLPSMAVQRSLTLIAKVIQSLANLNANVRKEEFMGGVKSFLADNLLAMVDYIRVVSNPTSDLSGANAGNPTSGHDHLCIINSMRQRGATRPALEKEAMPLLPHLDTAKNLAIIASSLQRTLKDSLRPIDTADGHLEALHARCLEIEEHALQRVNQLASRAYRSRSSRSSRRRKTSHSASLDPLHQSTNPIPSPSNDSHSHIHMSSSSNSKRRARKKPSRPSTAPPESSPEHSRHREYPIAAGPRFNGTSSDHESVDEPLRFVRSSSEYGDPTDWHHRSQPVLTQSTSAESIPSYRLQSQTSLAASTPSRIELPPELDDTGKWKKGILRARGILTRR